ncbi:hypothetical protein HYV70_03955 [Candidatus Uhrbacteria bacterium]|nr:hypothetical protein [Candidatus Uhrbacteria bacterium]
MQKHLLGISFFIIGSLFTIIFFLLSTRPDVTSADYFNGKIHVETIRTSQKAQKDQINFHFTESGDYAILFLLSESDCECGLDQATVPEARLISIAQPQIKRLENYYLSPYLQVIIIDIHTMEYELHPL